MIDIKRLNQDIEDYIARGGVITILPAYDDKTIEYLNSLDNAVPLSSEDIYYLTGNPSKRR